MPIRFANNFNKPLAAGCTSGDLTISLSGANATALQTAIGGALGADYLFATLVDASNNIEIIKITAINTGTGALTVQRGQDLTTARAWLSGDILSVRPNRQALLDALQVNVSKANSGVNNDITSLTGLATPLSIAQGGTGGNSEAAAKAALNLETGVDLMPWVAPSTSGRVLTSNGSAWSSAALPSTGMTSGTSVATTSGNTVEFNSIPAAVQRIQINFSSVGHSGLSWIGLQLGTSSSFISSGYAGSIASDNNSFAFSASFRLTTTNAANAIVHGVVTLRRVGTNTNTWAISGATGRSEDAKASTLGGSITLGAQLTRVRLINETGGINFNAGTASISWEF